MQEPLMCHRKADDRAAIQEEADKTFLDYLVKGCLYDHVEQISPKRWVAVYRLLFHWTMVGGDMHDLIGFDLRYCYANEKLAMEALAEWRSRRFEGEPLGWHRHPDTGRRRPEGDAAREFIDP